MNMIKLLATNPDTISPMISIVIMVGMLVLMYVFMIVPQKNKEKADDARQLRNELAGREKSQSMSWKDRHVSSLDLTALG